MNANFRKGMLLTLALFFSQASHADQASQPLIVSHQSCLYCNRFYVGATAGLASVMDRESTSTPTRNVHYSSASGPLGGAILGFDFCLYKRVRLELEGFTNAQSIQISDDQSYAPQSAYTVRMRYNLGLRALPTYEFTPQTAGHLALGYSYGKFSIRDTGNYGYVNKMFGQNGIQFGFGMETFLAKWVLLRGDILYTMYPWQTTNGVTNTTPPSFQLYRNAISTLEADLSVIYKLGQV